MKALLLPLFLVASQAAAADLAPQKKPELAAVLGLSEELTHTPVSSSQPYIVRVFAVPREVGECGGPVATCPDVRLLVTVSTGDLGEQPSLFELPAQKGWEFVGWSAPGSLRGTPAAVFTVRTTLPETNVSPVARKAWRPRTYRVLVTPGSATYAAQ